MSGTITMIKVLDAIDRLTRDRGFPPTLDEISQEIDLSKTGVHYQMRNLELEKLIEREDNSPRALRITPHGDAHLKDWRSQELV